jgi:Ca-activated chloride channel family protein
MKRPLLNFLLLLALLARSAAAAPLVNIVHPPPDQPLFGTVEVRAEVWPGGSPIRRVELYFDRLRIGVKESPPYRFTVDAGQDNSEHHIEVVVTDAAGAATTAGFTTPALRADLTIDVRLQQLFVNLESGSRPLAGLSREDFTILDDGVPQTIATFEHGDIPFTAVLLLDASTSMQKGKLTTAVDGVRSFVHAMNRLDEAKLFLFSDHTLLETPFTSVPSILTLGLTDVEAQGGTALNDALYLGLKRLDDRLGRKVIVLLSDGVDVESVLPMATVREVARRSQASLYWLRLHREGEEENGPLQAFYTAWRDAEGHRKEMDQLRAAVLESGGRLDTLERVEDVPAALTRILQDLRDQYVLGYSPTVHRGAGTWHKIELKVRGAGRVRVQEGYLER